MLKRDGKRTTDERNSGFKQVVVLLYITLSFKQLEAVLFR